MLSNKQKMDLLMESLEAVESDSKSLNEDLKKHNTTVYFTNDLSNDDRIALGIKRLSMAIFQLTRDDLDDGLAKRKFILDKFKQCGIDLEKLQSQVFNIKRGDFNYPPEKKPDRGPFGV